jgi:2,4-dienoyl-CoA reductase-like NADH-dependent reductase (Old Yellow Enzyme family)/ribulose 1,5-bisphosphate synthetase/thiazole synthase
MVTNEAKKIKLLEPFKLAQMELRNRIVMGPMVTNYGTEDGYVSERTKAYYEERAKGGAGLIIIEATSIDFSRNKCFVRQLSVDDDRFIPGFRDLIGAIHKHGAKVALQLHHGGNVSRRELTPLRPVSASAISYQDAYQQYMEHGEPAEELSLDGITNVVALYAKAAERAHRAGFDGVEIHGATGYLIGQFLSTAKNRRNDDYGGELKNRARFLLEIISAIRESVGQDYPVWCKLSAEETGLAGGITFEETKELIQLLEGSDLDAVHISGLPQARSYYSPPGYFVDFCDEVKKLSRLPVIITGGIDAELGEKILREGKADLVAMGRAFIADPEWPRKIAGGRMDDIRPCLRDSCCRDCIAYKDTPVTCTVNAMVGREKELAIRSVERPKRIVVVGGGPAGMEAARVAATGGHDVTLLEKGAVLGGQLLLASIPPNKELIEKFRNYLIAQNQKLGVKVELNKEASASLIRKMNPDVVILATGSAVTLPNIKGLDQGNVSMVEDVLVGKAEIGESIIVIGGGTAGCETAHYLAKKGKKVIIVEMLDDVMKNIMPSTVRAAFLEVLTKAEINIMTGTRVEEITSGGIITCDESGNPELFPEIMELFPDTYIIGDAVKPGLINDAMQTALNTILPI